MPCLVVPTDFTGDSILCAVCIVAATMGCCASTPSDDPDGSPHDARSVRMPGGLESTAPSFGGGSAIAALVEERNTPQPPGATGSPAVGVGPSPASSKHSAAVTPQSQGCGSIVATPEPVSPGLPVDAPRRRVERPGSSSISPSPRNGSSVSPSPGRAIDERGAQVPSPPALYSAAPSPGPSEGAPRRRLERRGSSLCSSPRGYASPAPGDNDCRDSLDGFHPIAPPVPVPLPADDPDGFVHAPPGALGSPVRAERLPVGPPLGWAIDPTLLGRPRSENGSPRNGNGNPLFGPSVHTTPGSLGASRRHSTRRPSLQSSHVSVRGTATATPISPSSLAIDLDGSV